MENEKVILLDEYEQRVVAKSLLETRNDLLAQQQSTEDVDDLLLKVIDAPPAPAKKRWRGHDR